MGGIKCTWFERTTLIQNGEEVRAFRNLETGEVVEYGALPIGALWCAVRDSGRDPDAYPQVGYDGKAVICMAPGRHAWLIDGKCSNCGKPDDDVHRCWVRHGTVGELVTVDKNGNTCNAGAGSLLIPGWHGFLRNGELVT